MFLLVGALSPNPCDRRFHLRRRSSSHASYHSFPRKHGNSFITLLVLSPTSLTTCRGPLIRLFFFLLALLLRLGFRIFNAKQSGQICLVGQQLTIRFLGLVVFCVCRLFFGKKLCILCPQLLDGRQLLLVAVRCFRRSVR